MQPAAQIAAILMFTVRLKKDAGRDIYGQREMLKRYPWSKRDAKKISMTKQLE